MRKWIKPISAVFLIGLVLMNPENAAQAARGALSDWVNTVIPALFPFMAAIPALTSEESQRFFGKLLGKGLSLFRCSADYAPAVLTGWLSGSPAGAVAAVKVADSGDHSPVMTLRCALLASGASPAFWLAMPLTESGFKGGGLMIVSQLLGALTTALFTRCLPEELPREMRCEKIKNGETPILLGAAGAMVIIGAYMLLMEVTAAQLTLITGEKWHGALLMLLEMTGGCQAAAVLNVPWEIKMALIAAIGSFGGLSVILQCLSFLKKAGIGAADYIGWKLIQAGWTAIFAFCLRGFSVPIRENAPMLNVIFPSALSVLLGIGIWLTRKNIPNGSMPFRTEKSQRDVTRTSQTAAASAEQIMTKANAARPVSR